MADCNCGYTVTVAPRLDLLTGREGDMVEGDFHVCPACADVLVLAGGRWRPATVAEIFSAPPEARVVMARISAAILRSHDAIARRGVPRGMVN